jgi:hypothetical protein
MKYRIFRAPNARYYAEDILEGPDVYADDVLAELARHGFNGIWLRARLRDVCRTPVFPELGADAPRYQERLNQLRERAQCHGVRVWLYLNEPLCFPADHPFWQQHPEVKGAPGASLMDEWPRTFAVCTSHPDVQAFLRDGAKNLFHACPSLGGVFTITRSEHHTHCWSHVVGEKRPGCPRCDARDPAELIAEVTNLAAAGIHAVAPDAQVIAWNWSWDEWQARIIDRLDRRVTVMADFESGGRKVIAGNERDINEYSLSYIGPSDQFLAAHRLARARGQALFAKLQIGTTHELATVNNLPLIPNLLGKARAARQLGVDGALCCWNFGNRLTLNTCAFHRFVTDDRLAEKSDDDVLAAVACEYLGVTDAAPVLAAWRGFVSAFDRYPFHRHFLYSSPVNYAVAYPLPRPGDPDRPMPWTWIPLQKPYGTRLRETTEHPWGATGFTLEEYRDAFAAMTEEFAAGLELYEQALAGNARPETQRELRNARVIAHVLRSTANIYAAYLLAQAEPFDEPAWREIAADEVAHLAELAPLLSGETEIGFHSEANAWFFTEHEVREKIANLRQYLRCPLTKEIVSCDAS